MTDYSYSLNETILNVQNVNVSYGQKHVLRDCNFTIKNIVRPGLTQGQVSALLAPSGMGKTQLFRCIAGLKKPDSGSVTLAGDKPVQAGMVGVVAQDYPLFEHQKVIDNIMIAARRKMDKAKASQVALDLLARFGLSDRAGVYPHQLSGGQRQRVAILQEMVCSGQVLLMDEPFSGLDVLMKEEVQRLIEAVAAANELNSVIITTHDIQSAIAIADTIHLMGRDRDAQGNIIPGARIVREYNLMDMGLTWRPDVESLPQFHELEAEIKARFHEL